MSQNEYYFPLREVQVGLFGRGAKCTNLTQKLLKTQRWHCTGMGNLALAENREIYEFKHCLQANPKISALISCLWSWPVHVRSP